MTMVWVKHVGAWVLSTLIIWGFLLLSPLGKPTVIMQVQTTTSGFSQMFFSTGENGFSEQQSRSALINPQTTQLEFPFGVLRGTVGNFQRWDPSDAPGDFVLSSVRLKGLIATEDVPLTSLLPSLDMSAIEIGPEGASFRAESNDAQTLLQMDLQRFYWNNMWQSAIAAAIIAFLLVLATSTLAKRRRRASPTPPQVPGLGARDAVSVPRIAVVFFAALLAAPLWILFRGSQAIGISWDEPTYVDSLQEFFRSGWFVPEYFFTNGTVSLADSIVHGPVGPIFGHAISVISGNEPLLEVSSLAAAYESRHLAMALLAAAGIGFIGVAAAVALSSWRWGLIAAATVAAIPLYIGHGMFNIQDLPTAVGFTAVLLSFILLARQSFDATAKARALPIITLILGLVLMVGTRPGIWFLFFLTWLASLLVWLVLDTRSKSWRAAVRILGSRAFSTIVSTIAAYAVLWIISPNIFSQPLAFLRESLSTTQAFAWEGTTLTAGILMPAQPPPQYLLLWFGAQLPVIIALAAVIGIAASLVLIIQSLTIRTTASPVAYAAVPFLALVLGTPIGLWVTDATLYSGIRQLLFLIPPIAMLAVFGVHALLTKFMQRGRTGFARATWIAFGAGLAIPFLGQIQLFPYSFTYFNAPATVQPIEGNWEIDGWWLSGRELLQSSPSADRSFCVDFENRPRVECVRFGLLAPYLETGDEGRESIALRADQYLLFGRLDETFTSDTCTPLGDVTRPLALQSVTLSRSFVCDVSLFPYPSSGITTTFIPVEPDPAITWGEDPYLLWGWGIPSEAGVTMIRSQAAVGFALTDQDIADTDAPWELLLGVIGGTSEGGNQDVDISVNGIPVGTIPASGGGQANEQRFEISPEVLTALGSGRVIVGFTTPESADTPASGVNRDMASGGVSLTSVTLSP